MVKKKYFIIVFSILSISFFVYSNKTLAAVFGPQGNGGLTTNVNSSGIYCASSTPSASGTLNSMSANVGQQGGTPATLVGFSLYDADGAGGAMNTFLTSNNPSSTAMPASLGWATSSISYSLTAGHVYYMCVWGGGTGYQYSLNMDNTAGYNTVYQFSNTWQTWPTPAGSFTNFARRLNMYATYSSTTLSSVNDINNFLTFQ